MKHIYTAALKAIIFFMSMLAVKEFCTKQTDGFTVWGITPDRPFREEFATTAPDEAAKHQIDQALGQPYQYGAYGAQAYVFFSKDGQYALKLFKQRIYTNPKWFKFFPIPFVLDRYKEKKTAHRLDKCKRDFASYKLAFEELQDLTGVVFVHLNKSQDLKKKLTIIDKLGIAHQIDLDSVDFVLQKRAEHVHDRIQRQIDERDFTGAQRSIAALLAMITERCKRGISDRDPSIDTNCGFIGPTAIKIDVGRLGRDPSVAKREACEAELKKITGPFRQWLAARAPELAEYLDEECNRSATHLDFHPPSIL